MTPPEAEPTVVPAEPVEASPTKKDLGWTLSGLLIVLSYLLLVLAFLLFAQFNLALFLEEGWLFLLPGLVFVAVLGGLSRPWTHLVAGLLVAAPALVVLVAFRTGEGLIDPTRGIESQVAALLALAALWALPAAFIGMRLGRLEEEQGVRGAMRRRHGRYALAMGCIFGAFFLASCLATYALGEADDAYDFAPDETVKVVLEDFEFHDSEIVLEAGQITEIVVDNRDGAYHTFTYEADGLEYDHKVPGGQTVSFLVRFTEPGEVAFWCEPHSNPDHDEGMVGHFTVEE